MIPTRAHAGESMTKHRLEKLIEEKKKSKDPSGLDFLESLQTSLEKWGDLTAKQMIAFERIEYLSSEQGMEYVISWQKEYSSNLTEKAKICSRYYLANPPYFNDLASKTLSNPAFIPTEKQYRAMCENKYTSRVIKEFYRDPDFANGDIVQVRENTTLPYHLYVIKGKPCVVINNNTGTITTHAKGAKVYKVLPFGQSKLFECQERYLKGFKSPKKA